MKSLRSISAAVALCVASIAPAMAQGTTFANGSFDAGSSSLASWTTEGDVMVVGATNVAALTTASLGFQDDFPLPAGFNNNSGTAAVDFFYASDLAGVSFAALDAVSGVDADGFENGAIEGSAIRQNFFATAGDVLTVKFDWTFLSAEKEINGIAANPDFGFLAINGSAVKFIDALSAPAVSQFTGTFVDLNKVNWGWSGIEYTYTADTTGAVSLVLGVVDVVDSSYTSELRVDNISVSAITAVPEPESYAMLLAGLALMGGIARRRSQG